MIAPRFPSVPLAALDQLWFQVSGTVCNLRCRHCFISCSPDNHSFWFMTREMVRSALEESAGMDVKEYYFTGGEPFMNTEMEGILEDTLVFGPATVLTNATLFPPRRVAALRDVQDRSAHVLTFRVSIDGYSPETNDPIRGEGTFERAMEGVGNLVAAGFRPIITAMQSWPCEEMACTLRAFRNALEAVGYDEPRLKILPPLLIGEEARRNRGYQPCERVTHEMLHGYDLDQLLCSRARLVTASGVYACPILLDYPSARLADTLSEAVTIDAPLAEAACYTCYTNGAICSNATTGVESAVGAAESGACDAAPTPCAAEPAACDASAGATGRRGRTAAAPA
ncbi:MAG: radical SAM protein [Gemmatimonadetes bacterium]|nr:radical SAM protein [Gemmatimonadota bacterium]MYE17372.1 radical SAM protein [Gemmatimonadota bacterium]